MGLPDGKKLRICPAVSTEYRRVSDGQTDGQTNILRQHSRRSAYVSRVIKSLIISGVRRQLAVSSRILQLMKLHRLVVVQRLVVVWRHHTIIRQNIIIYHIVIRALCVVSVIILTWLWRCHDFASWLSFHKTQSVIYYNAQNRIFFLFLSHNFPNSIIHIRLSVSQMHSCSLWSKAVIASFTCSQIVVSWV